AVRKSQIERLQKLKNERNDEAVTQSLEALTHAASSGEGNLLELAVDAARAKATVGEISDAMEKAFTRHEAKPNVISGVYANDFGNDSKAIVEVRDMVSRFAERQGCKPKIYIAKIGQDGHDRGQKVVATAFADLGFDVIVGPLFQTPAEAAEDAIEGSAHAIGVSSLAAGHLTLVPELREELNSRDRQDIMVIVGGVIPPQDFNALYKAGAKAIFPPGSVITDAAKTLLTELSAHLGHNERP
ncbi:MAG: methylmalonyl-CoA mutase family protein, partial [Pseudomonadota bacterium]|nr:methylmalonyl-CoA mutase family protein [Pseudomonadota bacterium]